MNKTRMLLLLSLLSAFPPLATDMYLPAIPLLVSRWQEPLSMVNLTLVAFFVSYCIALLFHGPLSDRYGRRPVLLIGIGVFILASILCASSNNVSSMIVYRIIQAAGGASAATLALAISKDVFEKHTRGRILAYIGIIMALAPMLAPVFGGWILTWFSWRWIFISQAAIAGIAWVGVWRMPETLRSPAAMSALQTAGIYLGLFQNRRYLGFALMFSLIVFPHFAFIAGSGDIYITRLGLSEQAFGYFFALNAAAIMSGSMACSRLLRRYSAQPLITAGLGGVFLGGTLMLTRSIPDPWGLTVPMAVISFCFGLTRPPSNNLVLEQVNQHAGAASSLLILFISCWAPFPCG